MTGTDVAVQQPQTEMATLAPVDLISPLRSAMEAMDLAQVLGEQMCRSPFAPKGFRGNRDATAAAILAGMEMGMTPAQALRSFDVVEGSAGLTSHAMRALITRAGHHIELRERSAERVTLAGRRRGEQEWTEITWTIQDAQRAGLAGKQVWKAYPAAMLLARCTTTLAAVLFADVVAGIPCTEELADLDPVDITASVEVTTPEPAGRPTKAAILAAAGRRDEAPADTPPAPDPAPAVPALEVERAVLPSTDDQMRRLGSLMHQLGVTGTGSKARRLTITARIVDRPITAATDLTQDEAKTVIDTLTSVLNDPARAQLLHQLEHGDAQPPTDDAADATEDAEDAELLDDPNGQWDEMDGGEAAGEELLG